MERKNGDPSVQNRIHGIKLDGAPIASAMCVTPACGIFDPAESTIPAWNLSSGGIRFISQEHGSPGTWTACRPTPAGCHDYYIVTAECFLELSYGGETRHKGRLAPGTLITSHPGEEFRLNGNGHAGLLQIRCSVQGLENFIERSMYRDPNLYAFHIPTCTVDVGLGLLALTHQFAHDAKVPLDSPYSIALRQGMLNRIAMLWSRNAMTGERHSEMLVPARARRVAEYIEANLKQGLTLPHLSAVAGVSRAHFARAFRNSIGMSPHQFVRHRRLAAAMRLIRSSKLTLAEIAHGCGFADQAHLTRTFKLQYGDIPTSFRRPNIFPATHRAAISDRRETVANIRGNRIYFQGSNEILCKSSYTA